MTLLGDYAAGVAQPTLDGRAAPYDEVVGADGVRAAWAGLAGAVGGLDAVDVGRVAAEIGRLLADEGVTSARPGGAAEPWVLDPVPLVVGPAEWAELETGLAQRAELLNAVLGDLYGERRLLADGVVPAAVVLGHAGYEPVMARPEVPDPRPLVLTATDLGRDDAGRWRVVADRTEAPSGLGYAVEGRRVLTRVLPQLHRAVDLHRLDPFLAALRSALLAAAGDDLGDPRVVVLSPGSRSETAYDQAVLAGLLGFPLVQGGDLVVRDGWVCLRTLDRARSRDRAGAPPERVERLQRVDVVLRRVDAAWSDPLELRADTRLGVAGLARAVRRGRLRSANALGAGVLENPGLAPYLPAACERLLGEPLRLSAADTWWCGEPEGLEQVLAALDPDRSGDRDDGLVVRPIDGPAAPWARLAPRVLRSRVLAEPHRFVGQRRLPLSQAPSWGPSLGPGPGAVRPRPVTLRTFTLRYGSAYRPLAGGLASVHEGDRIVAAKDVWVLKSGPTEADQGLADVLPLTTTPATPSIVPRALGDLFWFGRYAERAEDLLRLVLAGATLGGGAGPDGFGPVAGPAGGPAAADAPSRRTVDAALPVVLAGTARFVALPPEPAAAWRAALLDEHRPGSVAQSLAALRQALAGVRDQVSVDTWRVFGTAERAAGVLRAAPSGQLVVESAGRMLTGVLSLQGVTASMIRDDAWHAIGVGRHLERALQVVRLLHLAREHRGLEVDRAVLGAVLVAAESVVTHRRRYRGTVRTAGVLDLLLLDPDNPRSLAFALAEAGRHLGALTSATGSTRPERLVSELLTAVAGADVRLLATTEGVDRPHLAAFLDDVVARVEAVAEAVVSAHLASGPRPLPFGPTAVEEAAR